MDRQFVPDLPVILVFDTRPQPHLAPVDLGIDL